MAQPEQPFVGLPMPVFTAFGWAGQEAAVEYALSQLEQFVKDLYNNLPRDVSAQFQHFGLDRQLQSVYLAADPVPERDAYVAFMARPMSFQLLAAIDNKTAVTKALKNVNRKLEAWCQAVSDLGAGWSLHIQQHEYNSSTGEHTNYKDIFKDEVSALDLETARTVIERATYLNNDDSWVTPIHLSFMLPSEKVAAMGISVVRVMSDYLNALRPTMEVMTGRSRKQQARAKSKRAARLNVAKMPDNTAVDVPVVILPEAKVLDQFAFETQLKPLHLRRGFINLEPKHWPFFSSSARSETRAIKLELGTISDENSTVWRLVPNDQARIVLSDQARDWLEENFEPDDGIRVTAVKSRDGEIIVLLEPFDE